MSLYEQIQEMKKNFIAQVPEDALKKIMSASERLEKSGIAGSSLKKGDKMPPFSLPNANGKTVSSDALLNKCPLVINFYRGGWCPYCNLELKAFQEILQEIKGLGAQLVAISPNLPDKSLSSIEKNSLSFEVLSDLYNKVSRQFGIVFTLDEELRPIYRQFGIDLAEYNGNDTFELPIPATYVVNTNGIIELAFVDSDYTKRLEPEEVLDSLRNLRG